MPNTPGTNSWITYRRPNAQARLRLFCFPYAGGSAAVFRLWADGLPAHIEVCPIQYPGRENRLMERPFLHVTPLLESLAQAIRPYLDMPFAFFGHSLGGVISYELTRRLRREGQPGPLHMLVSACRAPHIPDPDPPIHGLPEPEFVDELRRLNGTPEPVLQNAELMQLLMPALRADFEVIETYAYTPEAPLDCPVSAFGGETDIEVSESELAAWREHTRSFFALRMFPGDHFYLHTIRQPLLQAVAQTLEARTA